MVYRVPRPPYRTPVKEGPAAGGQEGGAALYRGAGLHPGLERRGAPGEPRAPGGQADPLFPGCPGAPLPGLSVRADPQEGGKSEEGYTDYEGKFILLSRRELHAAARLGQRAGRSALPPARTADRSKRLSCKPKGGRAAAPPNQPAQSRRNRFLRRTKMLLNNGAFGARMEKISKRLWLVQEE